MRRCIGGVAFWISWNRLLTPREAVLLTHTETQIGMKRDGLKGRATLSSNGRELRPRLQSAHPDLFETRPPVHRIMLAGLKARAQVRHMGCNFNIM